LKAMNQGIQRLKNETGRAQSDGDDKRTGVRDALADALDLAGYEAEAGAMRLLPTALIEADETSLSTACEVKKRTDKAAADASKLVPLPPRRRG
jgi:hypothetical protein